MVDLVDAHGRPRVVVTGMGVKTPGRRRPRHVLGDAVCAGQSARPRPSSASTRPSSRSGSRARSSTSTRSPYLGPKEVRRGRPRHPARVRAPRPTRSSDAGELGADPSRCAVIAATGVGGLETLEENESTFLDAGREPGQPVLRPDDDAERDRRDDLDPLRLHRPEPLHRHRVRGRRQRDRRGRPHDPRRQRRGRRRRRHRGPGHAAHGRRRSPAWAR